MPELDLNYDLPWLQQAPDSNKPMSLAEAFQVRQNQQRLASEKALLPLKIQEAQAQIANAALDHQIAQEKMDIALKLKANDAEGWKQMAEVTSWLDPAQVGPIYAKGPFSPELTRFLEGRQQSAEMFSAKGAATAAKLEGIQDTLKTREMISDAAIKAANERTSAVNTSREKIAQDALVARANLEVVKQNNRITLESGRTVKWAEFLNRHLKSYTDATGKTPEEAAKLLRVLYDENVGASPLPGGAVVNPKDPANLFMPQ